MTTKDWVTLLITILTFAAGSGWLKYLLERRDVRRKEHQAVLDGFLRPLEAILEQNKRVHALLTADQQFQQLEFAPDHLQQHFASLPVTDVRRGTWKALIDGVIKDNERAKVLIQSNHGRLLSAELQQRCFDFVHHSDAWAALWRSAVGDRAVPEADRGAGRLSTPAFPAGFDVLLAKEIAERVARAEAKP